MKLKKKSVTEESWHWNMELNMNEKLLSLLSTSSSTLTCRRLKRILFLSWLIQSKLNLAAADTIMLSLYQCSSINGTRSQVWASQVFQPKLAPNKRLFFFFCFFFFFISDITSPSGLLPRPSSVFSGCVKSPASSSRSRSMAEYKL